MSDTQHHINESADKIRLDTKIVRGSGTRDQETIKVTVKGDDATEAVVTLNETLEQLAETADTVRAIQPDGGDE